MLSTSNLSNVQQQIIQNAAAILQALHVSWDPHTSQKSVLYAIFYAECKQIFIECGRKWGKTEIVCYILWRWCLTNPGSACYYLAPFQKQAREILWANRRMPYFGPAKYVAKVSDQEMRITFKNGSFIKCDGSDNYEAYRGITPKGPCIYEEFKDFRPEFHEGFEPNLAAHGSPLIIIGTPPETDDNQFCRLGDYIKNNDYRRAA